MAKYKNIRMKMKGGKSRMQRVKVLASGKYRFVKNLTRSRSRSTRTKTRTKTRRVKRRLVRRYRRKRKRGGKNTQATVFKLLRLGSLVAPGAIRFSQSSGSTARRLGRTVMAYGGVEPNGAWNSALFAQMWTPFVATCAATWGIPKLVGILRRL